MTTANVYLTFNGNCKAAFDFYRSVLGGEFTNVNVMGDMPDDDNYKVPEEDKNKIMHIGLPVSKETILMGADSSSYYGDVQVGGNFSISLNTDSKEEADRLFNGLSAGGKVIMAMENTFWGAYFGMFTDKFGINWMIDYGSNPLQ